MSPTRPDGLPASFQNGVGGHVVLRCVARLFGKASTRNAGKLHFGVCTSANSATQPLLIEKPASRRASLFLLVEIPQRQPAARQPSPAVRATGRSPLNSRCPARMPPGLARVRRRSASSLVVRGRAVASLTTRRKVSRSHVDSGKDRPRHDASAARVHAAEILIRAQRPPAAPSVNISLRVLAYGAVSATG